MRRGQLPDESRQRAVDRSDRVGVVGVGRGALLLEVGPLAHQPSPLDVGIADELFQEVLRVEDPSAAAGQDGQRLVKVGEQEFAPLDATAQHDL